MHPPVLQSKICITLLQTVKSFLSRYASSSVLFLFAALHPSRLTKQDLTPRGHPTPGPAAEGRGSKPTSSRSTETSWVAPPRHRETPHAHFLTGANTNHFVLLRRSGHRPAGRDVRPEAAVTCTSDSSLGERVPKSLAPLQAAVHHATGAGMSLL